MDLSIIDRIASILFSNLLLTKEEYELYTFKQVKSISEFVFFLQTDVSKSKSNSGKALEVAYELLNKSGININANTNSASNGCKIVSYKPSNPQFAIQGATKSSTQILQKNATTVSNSILVAQRALGLGALSRGIINPSGQPAVPFIYGSKAQKIIQTTCIKPIPK